MGRCSSSSGSSSSRAALVAVALVALAGAAAAGKTGGRLTFLGRRPDRSPPAEEALRAARPAAAGPSLAASPGSMCAGEGVVTVEWSGVENATSGDFVAVYSPPDAEAHDYLDYYWARDAGEGYLGGSGALNFSLINLRGDYGFRYYQGNNAYRLAATSNDVKVCADLPLQGRLALTGNFTQMRVGWVSGSAATPRVQYGSAPDALDRAASGVSRSYTADDMCAAPANVRSARRFRDVGHIHDVLLTGLRPGSTVFYRYGTDGAWSDVAFFIAAPETGPRANVSVLAFGDMGAGYYVPPAQGTADRLTQHATAGDTDLMLHIGDISYARSHGWIWDLFGHVMSPSATAVPYMVGVGNHEYDYAGGPRAAGGDPSGTRHFEAEWTNYGNDSDGECGRPLYERYHMPDNGNAPFWYSFDYGPLHVAVISGEHDPEPGSDMHEWLRADLARADRGATPWLVVAGHRPMYNSENYTSDGVMCEHLRANLEPLLYKYGVDAYVAGHYHAVEVTAPVFQGRADPRGTRHFTIGSAGASLDDAAWFANPWSEFQMNSHFAYGRFSFVTSADLSSTSLVFELHLNKDDSIAHSLTVTKQL